MTKTATDEPDYSADMKLPAGMTCDDCVHSRRCFGFGFAESGNTSCDFWPNVFRRAVETDIREDSDHADR